MIQQTRILIALTQSLASILFLINIDTPFLCGLGCITKGERSFNICESENRKLIGFIKNTKWYCFSKVNIGLRGLQEIEGC